VLLPEIGLLPPPLHSPWVGSTGPEPTTGSPATDSTADQQRTLFWYDPPWHFVSPAIARKIIAAVDALHVPTAVLGRDIGEASIGDALLRHPIAPYRPDRYGVQLDDLQHAPMIDIRLARARDYSGRYAYAPEQVTRWLGADVGEEEGMPTTGATHFPAPGWPAELPTVESLSGKFAQLRLLQPGVQCGLSVTPYFVQQELPAFLKAKPDVVILRMDDSDELQGMRLATTVVAVRQLVDAHCPHARLWVVPPDRPTPDDCAKLYALGANAVAIDWWCQPLIANAPSAGSWQAVESDATNPFLATAKELLYPLFERVAGLLQSCGVQHASNLTRKHLVSSDPTIAKQLGIRH